MIFVAVSTFGFERLVKKMDEIASRIDEEVVMQIGRTRYTPRNARYFDFVAQDEFHRLCQEARVVVTHGAMTVMDALEQGTPVIAIPRLKKYDDVIDDHQLYLVEELERQGKVTAVYDLDRLEDTIESPDLKPHVFAKDRSLVNALKGYLAQFERHG